MPLPTRSSWVLFGALALVLAGPLAAVEQGDVAPPWRARDFAGQTVEFPAVTNGKPAVVVFWATWCGYCKAFMPYLKGIQSDFAQHGVKVVAINAKEDGSERSARLCAGLGFRADRHCQR